MATLDLGKVVGDNGQGVPSGGTAGQLLKKASSSNYDTEWASPDTTPASGSGNPITSGAVFDTLGNTQGAIAILSNNNTHQAISTGQYVYVRGHSTLAEGLYIANTGIGTNVTLTSSNLTAVSGGGLNAVTSAVNSNFNVYIGEAEKVVSVSRATAGLNTESVSDLAIPTKSGYTFYMWLCTSGTATIPMISCAPVANPTLLYYVASTAGSNANVTIRPMFIRN